MPQIHIGNPPMLILFIIHTQILASQHVDIAFKSYYLIYDLVPQHHILWQAFNRQWSICMLVHMYKCTYTVHHISRFSYSNNQSHTTTFNTILLCCKHTVAFTLNARSRFLSLERANHTVHALRFHCIYNTRLYVNYQNFHLNRLPLQHFQLNLFNYGQTLDLTS